MWKKGTETGVNEDIRRIPWNLIFLWATLLVHWGKKEHKLHSNPCILWLEFNNVGKSVNNKNYATTPLFPPQLYMANHSQQLPELALHISLRQALKFWSKRSACAGSWVLICCWHKRSGHGIWYYFGPVKVCALPLKLWGKIQAWMNQRVLNAILYY